MDLADIFRSLLMAVCCMQTVMCQDDDLVAWNRGDFLLEAQQTFHIIFHSYKKLVRPPEEMVEVQVGVTLRHIRSLDFSKQELQAVYDVDLEWYDSRLAWDADQIEHVIVNATDIWGPDVVYTNGVQRTQQLYSSDTVRIHKDGNVWWNKKELVTTYCPLTPGEAVHICQVEFGFKSNQRNDQKDRKFFLENHVEVSDDSSNNQWYIAGNASIETNGDNETDPTTVTVSLPLQHMSLNQGGRVSTEEGTSTATEGGYGTSDFASRQQSTTVTDNGAAPASGDTRLCTVVGVAVVMTTLCQHYMWR